MIYFDQLHRLVLHLPETTAYTCYGTPAFRVGKKLIARLKEDQETLAVYTPDRDPWMESDPDVFFITDHYRDAPYVLVRLKKAKLSVLKQILFEAWQSRASARALNAFASMR